MFKKSYAMYLLVIVSCVFLSHLAYSYFLGLITSYLYDDSLVNIRHYRGENCYRLTTGYLKEKIRLSSKPILLILGSSFSYGLGIHPEDKYSVYLQKKIKHFRILNASAIGDSGLLAFAVLKMLKSEAIFVDTLIIELNLFNFTSTHFSKGLLTSASSSANTFIDSYFMFYLTHPQGIQLALNLELDNLFPLGKKIKHPYVTKILPKNYAKTYEQFRDEFSEYEAFLTALFKLSKEVADQVYFFIPPFYKTAIMQSQFKLTEVEQEIKDINAICNRFPKIHCWQIGMLDDERDFNNIVHFNERGHRRLAQWMSRNVFPAKAGIHA